MKDWCFSAIFAAATSLLCAAGNAALIAHYELDDPTPDNGTVHDSSGDPNPHNGVIHYGPFADGVTSTTDRFNHANSAMAFNGKGGVIEIDQLLFQGNHATVAFWAKSAGDQWYYAVMVSQGHTSQESRLRGFAFQYGYPHPSDTVFIWGNNEPAAQDWNALPYGIDLEADTTWHHYAATTDGTVTKIYFDGVLAGTKNVALTYGEYKFTIGHDFGNGENYNRGFYGSIDDVQVYDEALTPEQILRVMNGEVLSAAVPEPASMVVWGIGAVGCAILGFRRRKDNSRNRADLFRATLHG